MIVRVHVALLRRSPIDFYRRGGEVVQRQLLEHIFEEALFVELDEAIARAHAIDAKLAAAQR